MEEEMEMVFLPHGREPREKPWQKKMINFRRSGDRAPKRSKIFSFFKGVRNKQIRRVPIERDMPIIKKSLQYDLD